MSVAICDSATARACELILPARDYDLDATLSSGQVFGWEQTAEGWAGVLGGRWAELASEPGAIRVRLAGPACDCHKLKHFLQTEVNLAEIIASFPAEDLHLRKAVRACYGLRLLRQDPWECLASFILSSTKQILQIRQIFRLLGERFGEAVEIPVGRKPTHVFPSAQRIASLTESDLRSCKMGFRAPYLLAAARQVAEGKIDLASLEHQDLVGARSELLKLDGVGEKIADCVLLFAYGFPQAFPVDVWVRRVLAQHYFRNRPVRPERLRRFIREHFGPQAGYAQQYLFHHIRAVNGKVLSGVRTRS